MLRDFGIDTSFLPGTVASILKRPNLRQDYQAARSRLDTARSTPGSLWFHPWQFDDLIIRRNGNCVQPKKMCEIQIQRTNYNIQLVVMIVIGVNVEKGADKSI